MATVLGQVLVGDEEWEVVNDDGFVYKRKKRPRLDPAVTATASSGPPPPDPAVEENNRRKRKKLALTKLKSSYQEEIDRWEHLSNTLQAMQEKAQIQQQQKKNQQLEEQATTSSVPDPPLAQSSDPTCRRLVDDLLAQAETHEAIIGDVSNLCDLAEALCKAQEERVNQSFFDLPVWASSPQELVKSLCVEEQIE